MKKILLSVVSLMALMSIFSVNALAVDLVVGNDSTLRSLVDTYHNFTIIDTNLPANYTGNITEFGYYAANTNPFRFVLVEGLVVKWVSDEITPAAVGVNTYTPAASVPVTAGWNIGMYFVSTGVIPYNLTGAPAEYTPNNYGMPVVGNTLSQEGTSNRTYSLIATGMVPCATIESGNITDSKGNTLISGFDQWGYNYQAHLFNGFADNYSRPATPVDSGDKLVMKWSDPWLSNLDCNLDGKLDRGLIDGVSDGISKGWVTNHYTGLNSNGKKYTDFYKIVWTGPGSPLWGQYTVVQEVWNDKSMNVHGLYEKLNAPGLGLNEQWTIVP